MRFRLSSAWSWLASAVIITVMVSACGSRTGLEIEPRVDGGRARDGGADGGRDGGRDGGTDASVDAGFDAGPDAGVDGEAPRDGGFDGGRDGGPDGGPAPSLLGCADGAREGFTDLSRFPRIAACAGGFSVAGTQTGPRCGRAGGDDGARPDGTGCAMADLCAEGWRVCASSAEVMRAAPSGCAGQISVEGFYATAQSGPGCAHCATGTRPGCDGAGCELGCAPNALTRNDVFGCGTVGAAPASDCAPLDRFSNNLCGALPASWSCPGSDVGEADRVVKRGAVMGGALCCRAP